MSSITPLYTPGKRLTGKAHGAAVIGGRFVKVAAALPATGGPIPIAHAAASTDPVVGVTGGDAAQDEHTQLFMAGHVVPVEVGTGGVSAGGTVMPDATGKAVAHTGTNVKAGVAITTEAAGGLAFVVLRLGI